MRSFPDIVSHEYNYLPSHSTETKTSKFTLESACFTSESLNFILGGFVDDLCGSACELQSALRLCRLSACRGYAG